MSRGSGWRWAVVATAILLLVVVPFLVWGGTLETWVLESSASAAPRDRTAMLLGGLLAADVLLPVPSSIVSVATGIALGPIRGTVVGTAGMTLGCIVGHLLGRHLGRAGLRRLVDDDDIRRFDAFGERFGDAALVVCRGVPVLAEASVLLAGAARVSWRRFLIATIAANLVISAVYATVGDLAAGTERLELGLMAALGIPGLAMVGTRVWLRRRRADDQKK